jgi:hypothetical protein
MKNEKKVISIHKRELRDEDSAFADFMSKSEEYFNECSRRDPKSYKDMSPSELEVETHRVLQEMSAFTPFKKDEITLVSGHSFPDIMAGTYYGVEVKSTKEDKWTSLGSSIVESTRNKSVEDIYMMFGKLGGDIPEFKFRPYQDCLSNIQVTHCPRYTIDMEIKEKNEETIFEKIHMSYQDFQKSEDKIDLVRDYYILQGRKEGKHEMPWWVGKKTIESVDSTESPSIRLLNSCDPKDIMKLKAEMLVLFPQIILSDYSEAALWLCTHRFLLCLNFRDLFSAGGQWKYLNNEKLDIPYPAVFGRLMETMPFIKNVFEKDNDLDYQEFNPALANCPNKLEAWINQAEENLNNISYKVDKNMIMFNSLGVDSREFLLNPQKYKLKH